VSRSDAANRAGGAVERILLGAGVGRHVGDANLVPHRHAAGRELDRRVHLRPLREPVGLVDHDHVALAEHLRAGGPHEVREGHGGVAVPGGDGAVGEVRTPVFHGAVEPLLTDAGGAVDRRVVLAGEDAVVVRFSPNDRQVVEQVIRLYVVDLRHLRGVV